MELKDLRIGNKIHGIIEDEIIECTVLAVDGVGVAEQPIWVETVGSKREYFDRFEPTPFTKKWFSKLNLSNDGHFYNCHAQFSIKNSKDYWALRVSLLNDIMFTICIFKYVHELQNIFHSLTGKELI